MPITVPGFLLRRLYVKGSLRNTEDGFRFLLKNSLGSGYAKRLLPLVVDGQELPMSQAYFAVGDKVQAFHEVSEESPASLAMNRESTIAVKGSGLAPGVHNVQVGFVVAGLGELRFDFTDEVT